MLYYCEEKDILNLKDKTIVPIIPVNCKAVMGAGLAKQFRDKYPNLFEAYKQYCHNGNLSIGHCALVKDNDITAILFPTKYDWQEPSKLEYIELGLNSLCKCLDYFKDVQIAIPPIGCGLGGLSVELVIPIIYDKLKEYKNNIFLVGF